MRRSDSFNLVDYSAQSLAEQMTLMEQVMHNTIYRHVYTNLAMSGLVGQHVWHLITGSYHCVGIIPTSDNAEDLSQFDPDCFTGQEIFLRWL